MYRRVTAIAVLLGACSSPPEPAPAVPDAAAEAEMRASLGALLETVDVLVLGEVHGSVEAPRAALEVAQVALDSGRGVAIGLEVWRSETRDLNAYLDSDGNDRAREVFLSSPFWTTTGDGRSSRAMYDLVEEVRQRARSGAAIEVFCFDAENATSQAARGATMAERIVERVAERPEELVVALAGNRHGRSVREIGAAPMAWHLRRSGVRIAALRLRHARGELWCCVAGGCSGEALGGGGSPDAHGPLLFEEADERGYEGVFDVGVAHASPPAVSAPINSTCTRSGKPVAGSSIAHYRGHLVGFCSPHCRDDFAAHVAERPRDRLVFDALIDAAGARR